MSSLMRLASLLAVVCMSGSHRLSADETLSREAVAKLAKASTGLVECKSDFGSKSGTGFCVHSSGLFVTNEHVIPMKVDVITIVIDAGLKTQKVLKAKVLRRDIVLDLALLKVEGDEPFTALELGSDKELAELTELIACGFPFGTALGKNGNYPAISVNVGSVTSLRQNKEGILHRIQLDAAVNPGNSGGPVLDRTGKVVGVVVSGIRGSGVNEAIPVSHVHRFLAQPEVILKLPAVKSSDRHAEFEFTAKAVSFLPTKKVIELELLLRDEAGKERRIPMPLADGTYRAKAVPFPARDGPKLFRVGVKYEDGSVTGATEDRACRIGDVEFKLSQFRQVRSGAKPVVLLADGRKIEAKVTGLDKVPVKVGNHCNGFERRIGDRR
jgi:S1-C subfamily serine protease